MKKTILIAYLCMCSLVGISQKEINLSIRYDNEFNRYEVLAKPNFSEKNFVWGLSQVTIVTPSNVLINKLSVKNIDGGKWEDASIIQAPEIAPDLSFHGVYSGGDKTDLIEGHETVLFYFSLGANVNPDKVRLFNNETDPKSSDKGMMGGDFRNSIVDLRGEELFAKTYPQEKKQIAKEIQLEEATIDAVVFPNVITNKKFQVKLDNHSKVDSQVLLILYTESGSEVFRKTMPHSQLSSYMFELPNKAGANLILKIISEQGSVAKRLVVE